jgi:general secretion pathway protein G
MKNIHYSPALIKANKGFTLIELLVVVTIITILTAVGMSNYRSFSQKARDSRRKADLESLRGALELYRADAGVYPATLPACGLPLSFTSPSNTNTYMEKIPCDPQTSVNYFYQRISSLVYHLGSCLEVDKSEVISGCLVICSVEKNSYCIKNP